MCMMCLERNCDRSTKGKSIEGKKHFWFNYNSLPSPTPFDLLPFSSPLLICMHTHTHKRWNTYEWRGTSITIPKGVQIGTQFHQLALGVILLIGESPPHPQVCGSWNHMFVVGLGKDNVWVNDETHKSSHALSTHGNSLKKALKLSRLVS